MIAQPLLDLGGRVEDGLVDLDLIGVGIDAFHLVSHVFVKVVCQIEMIYVGFYIIIHRGQRFN